MMINNGDFHLKMNGILDIVLPIYNAGRFLNETLSSLVESDNFEQYQLIAIDDGSTDNSFDILKKYAEQYTNIKCISRNNKGLVATLNEAISYCNAKYIARIDADDTVLHNRFVKQIEFFEANSDVYILGTAFNLINEDGVLLRKVNVPIGIGKIKSYAIFGSPICHPSVMMRGELFYQNGFLYKEEYLCEDYCLWLRVMLNHKIENLPIIGVNYRITNSGLSQSNVRKQVFNTLNLRDLSGIVNLSHIGTSHADNLFSPQHSDVNFVQYFSSFFKLIPFVYHSDVSLLWYFIYGANGMLWKLRKNNAYR